ncbi:MAG: YceD family protein [Bdellovibrionota bacterium]
MKQTAYPTKVMLTSLQETGEIYKYTNQTGELTKALADLIGDAPYNVEIQLMPAGNAFLISGKIKTEMKLICSHCGRDAVHEVNDDFKEIILIEDDRGRGGHTGHVGSDLVSDGPYCNYVQSASFDIADFVHEHIAAEEPYIVECGQPDCERVMKAAELRAGDPTSTDANPFSVLKNLKG